jgi:hypothetical protein
MKTKRTIRTMKRAGLSVNVHGWCGVPTGKAVRQLAKQRRAELRLAKILPSDIFRSLTVSGMTFKASIKALTLAAKLRG